MFYNLQHQLVTRAEFFFSGLCKLKLSGYGFSIAKFNFIVHSHLEKPSSGLSSFLGEMDHSSTWYNFIDK